MKNLITYFLFLSLGCFAQNIKEDNFYEENTSVNLFAFVGKKISVIEFDPNTEKVEKVEIDSITGEKTIHKSYIMDKGFKCKYLISRKVFNDIKKDTIDFVAYDHYGSPGFEDYENVLLYVSKSDDGKYYFHQKYQYDPLFEDKKGELFGCFTFRTDEDFLINSKLESFKIDLGNSIVYDTTTYNEFMLKTYVPKPFYKIKNNKARPVLGARIKELFLSKKQTNFMKMFENK